MATKKPAKKAVPAKTAKKASEKTNYDNEKRVAVFSNTKRVKETDDAMTAKFQLEGKDYLVGLKSRMSEKGVQYYKGLKDGVEVVLFINEDKEDKQPDLRGKTTVDGVEWFISLWKQKAESGLKYLSGVIQPPYEGGKKPVNQPGKNKGNKNPHQDNTSADFDDLPF